MGCDTKLSISSKWEIRDIIDVIVNHLDLEDEVTFKTQFDPTVGKKRRKKIVTKVRIESCHDVSPGFFHLFFTLKGSKNCRMMSVFLNQQSPFSSCLLLSLGADDEAIKIMRTIAEVLGGYFMENDCRDKEEMITGSADNKSDGLVYFVTRGIIENKFKNDSKDVSLLLDYIKAWDKKYKRN